jgi:hypothetical protein
MSKRGLVSVESQLLIQKTPPYIPKKFKSYSDIFIHSAKGSVRALMLSFTLRGGVSFLIRLVQVFRKRISFIDAIKSSLGLESRRFATMLAAFTFVWKFLSNSLYLYSGEHRKRQGAISGALAGLAVLIESPENRTTIAQQFSMRALQGGKNALKQRQLLRIPHGDTVLFSIAVAS